MTIRQLLHTVLLTAVVIAVCRTTADPDLWGHVRFGQDILRAGAVLVPDTYSFTSDRPWINHEWLAEVLMAKSFNAFGPIGLNLLKLIVTSLVLVFVWWRLKTMGAGQIAVPLVAVAALGILLRVHPVRPQLFSVLLFAVLLSVLTRADDTASARPLIVVPLLMAAWVNLHGGWIVGIGTLALWCAGNLTSRRLEVRDRVEMAIWTVAAAVATLVNPYGLGMWRFLGETIGVERPLISDWQPMLALPVGFWSSWLVPFVVAVLALVRARGHVNLQYTTIVVLLGAAALRVSRLDAFFALAVVFLMSPMLVPAGQEKYKPASTMTPSRSPLYAGIAVVSVIVGLVVVVRQLPRIDVNASGMPEPEVTAYIKATQLSGRMLTWFDWGEYAIWHFGPNVKVSMDGRRETVYSDRCIADHLQFYVGRADSLRYPDWLKADYVWVPTELLAVSALRSAGWHAIFQGPVSTILARDSAPRPEWVIRTTPVPRLFPGP